MKQDTLLTHKLLLILFFFIPPMLQAQQLPELVKAVKTLDSDPAMEPATWSLTVLDAASGNPLLLHNHKKAVATASTMKMLTTITALAVLGPNFRFETKLAYTGNLDADGILSGDLYIIGDGDPTLGSDRMGINRDLDAMLANWSQNIQEAGIKEIKGNIIGDAGIFSSQMTPSKWPWEDMGNYYGAGSSGLNIHENYYRLDLRPGKSVGAATEVLRTVPAMLDLNFINEITTGRAGSGDNGYIFGAPYTSARFLRGTIPLGPSSFSIKGSISDPAFYCAWRLYEELNGCGVKLNGLVTTDRVMRMRGEKIAKNRKIFYTYYSVPLRKIVKATNMKSINVYAESLAKRLAVKLGYEGSTDEAMEAISDYWKNKGVDVKGMYLRDGAGLSPNNSLTSFQLASIMYKARKSSYYMDLEASLPVAGKSGSLKSMLRGTPAEGRLRAKSGYISGVRSYAGFVKAKSGKDLIFVVISNNYACSAGQMRRKLEKIMVGVANGQ
ncbi:MAG: D-alanyl-D-alanine carboxypeptidase/D-alanyl-D-alanine-endopeptidase [Bacteroidia bacterium]|nr:D-alanyl-D-alanine carboxypeptidase/D-alanyl-D-alanine-endopeptidase [Bacteroidia bacterium]